MNSTNIFGTLIKLILDIFPFQTTELVVKLNQQYIVEVMAHKTVGEQDFMGDTLALAFNTAKCDEACLTAFSMISHSTVYFNIHS